MKKYECPKCGWKTEADLREGGSLKCTGCLLNGRGVVDTRIIPNDKKVNAKNKEVLDGFFSKLM